MKKIIMFIMMLIVLGSFTTAGFIDDLNNNALGYFKLENVTDEVNSNDFTNTGVSFVGGGIIDNAGDFELSESDYLAQILPAIYDINSGSWSVWIKPESDVFGTITIVDRNGASSLDWFGLQYSPSGNRQIRVIDRAPLDYGHSTATCELSVWCHIVLTSDGSTWKMYINGNLTTINMDGGFNVGGWVSDTTATYFRLGASNTDSLQVKFDGLIDEFYYSDSELTLTEVEFLYNLGSPSSSQQYIFTGEEILSVDLVYPINNTHYTDENNNDSKIYTGYINLTSNINANCSINDTRFSLNDTGLLSHVFKNNTLISEGEYKIKVTCDNIINVTETNIVFSMDETPPTITLYNPLNNSIVYSNFILNLSAFDINLLSVNVSILLNGNETKYNNFTTGIEIQTFDLYKIIDISNRTYWEIGNYTIMINATDRFSGNISLNEIEQINYFEIGRTDLNLTFFNSSSNDFINLTNVTLLINSTPIILNQTDTGFFLIEDIRPGSYSIFTTAEGFENTNILFEISAGLINNVSIYLISSDSSNKITYFIKNEANNNIVEGAIVTLLQRIEGIFHIVDQRITDFASSVAFEQDLEGIYKLNITADGFLDKSTDEYTPNINLVPYTIFLTEVESEIDLNMFDFLKYNINPLTLLIEQNEFNLSFIVDSNTSSINYFGWNTTINGSIYGTTISISNGGTASDIIDLTNFSLGGSFPVEFFINYNSDSGLQDYNFRRTYLRSALNKTINITMADSLRQLSSDIDEEQMNPETVKIMITLLFVIMVIIVLVTEGFLPIFAVGIALLIILGASFFDFFDLTLALIGNFVYWMYIIIIFRDEF